MARKEQDGVAKLTPVSLTFVQFSELFRKRRELNTENVPYMPAKITWEANSMKK